MNLYFFTQLEIKGAGDAFIANAAKEWRSVSDILSAWKSPNRSAKFCQFAGGINGDKVIKEMDNKIKKSMSMSTFLNLFDFDGFATKKIQLLENTQAFQNAYNGDFSLLFEKPITDEIKGLSQDSLNEFYEQLIDHTQDILESYALIKDIIVKEQKVEGGKFAGMNFCFTGACECGWKRKECEAKVTELGGKVTAVNKDLTYLVTDDIDSGSAKATKAKELGSKIITSFEFKKMCEE
ncbi:MAG: BRCT domain-containing protein [Campylobacter sp.]|nr:BRCT domain-containing protein [Campylobacter sp.]